MVEPISRARWEEAQQYEAMYWSREATRPDKLARDIADGHHWTMGALDIRAEVMDDADTESVLDIAGGDYPIGELFMGSDGSGYGILSYSVLDPAPPARRVQGIERIQAMAEDYRGVLVDEVWGYNVLQHVMDPAAVMATARHHAKHTIRWFDVVESPIYKVHPHSISADWLRTQFDGFQITRDIEGTRYVDSHRQKFIAIVAHRITTP